MDTTEYKKAIDFTGGESIMYSGMKMRVIGVGLIPGGTLISFRIRDLAGRMYVQRFKRTELIELY